MRRAVVFSMAVLAAGACSDTPTSPVDPGDALFHHSPPPSDFALSADGTTLTTAWTPAGSGGDAQHYVVQFQACTADDAATCDGLLHESAELDKTVGTYDLGDVEPGFYRARINAHDGGAGGPVWSDWTDIVQVGDDLTWYFVGFHRPVSPDPEVLNRVRRGSTVPLKFNVYEDEDLTEEITDVETLEASFGLSVIPCNGEEAEVEEEGFATTGGTDLRYDEDGAQFVQNWQAPRSAGCYEVTLESAGGSLSARFNVF